MKLFTYEECFVIACDKVKENPEIEWDSLLSVFLREGSPAVRGVEENPCEVGYVVSDEVDARLEMLFKEMEKRSKNATPLYLLKIWGQGIKGTKYPLSDGGVKALYKTLKEE